MLSPEDLAGDSEHSQQKALFCWAALNKHQYQQLEWLYAVPNGFFASSGQKGKMKAEGLRDGVPDLFLPVIKHSFKLGPDIQFCGLYIEMKREIYRNRKDGGCSEDQLKWLAYLNEAGYKAVVCYGWEEAKKAIEEYLS